MTTITIPDYAALRVSSYTDAEYTENVKSNICDAFCALVAEADQNYTTPQMGVLVMLQEYADLITALSKTKD